MLLWFCNKIIFHFFCCLTFLAQYSLFDKIEWKCSVNIVKSQNWQQHLKIHKQQIIYQQTKTHRNRLHFKTVNSTIFLYFISKVKELVKITKRLNFLVAEMKQYFTCFFLLSLGNRYMHYPFYFSLYFRPLLFSILYFTGHFSLFLIIFDILYSVNQHSLYKMFRYEKYENILEKNNGLIYNKTILGKQINT